MIGKLLFSGIILFAAVTVQAEEINEVNDT